MLCKTGYLIKDREQSALAESFRALRMSLQDIQTKDKIKSILIAGCSSQSSASLALVNLAAALTYAGKKVVIVDADLRSPSFHSYFLVLRTGLTDLLQDKCSLKDAVHATKIENLFVMPCGTQWQSPLTVITDKSLRSCIAQLEEQFDFVLINAPEILINAGKVQSDACILASKVQGTLLFIDSRQVRVQIAKKAINLIKGTRSNLLGVILGNVEIGGVFLYSGFADEERGLAGG